MKNSSYQILTYNDLQDSISENREFALDVLTGLSESPKTLPSRYFYDKKGSSLFQKITDLPEYYLTACEFNIFETKREIISKLLNRKKFNLIELGAGDGRKTSVLINHFLQKKFNFKYIPIDISESAMNNLIDKLNKNFPQLVTRGIVAEYFSGLKWLNNISQDKNMVLFLGSNLGNFNKSQARGFLRNLWNVLNDGDQVLIGFDLKKDIDLMLKAYNDAKGITSRFNLNLLKRINLELGGNFNLKKFRHYASYHVLSGAMESYLVSSEKQSVFIKEIGQSFLFEAWEPVHTEYSYKYLESDIVELAEKTGYKIQKQLYDQKNYFVDSIWKVQKSDSV